MDQKELALEYVAIHRLITEKERKIRLAFSCLSKENTVTNVVPPEVCQFIDKLVIDALGEDIMKWLDWWLYDCHKFNGKRQGLVSDYSGETCIENFNELWEFATGASAKEIQDKKL